MPIHLMYSNWT